MPITKKTCKCGCSRTFHGTERGRFYSDYCRVKWHRQKARTLNKDEIVQDNKKPAHK